MPRMVSSPGPKSHGFCGQRGFQETQACRFVEAGGRVGIGALKDAKAILRGEAGTTVSCAGVELEWYEAKTVVCAEQSFGNGI